MTTDRSTIIDYTIVIPTRFGDDRIPVRGAFRDWEHFEFRRKIEQLRGYRVADVRQVQP